jgi:ATP-dependent Clp protease ATP-binding subunit ClpB
MNPEKFTQKAQEAVSSAQSTAVRMGHQQIDGEHLHHALVSQRDGLIPKLLVLLGTDLSQYVFNA